jgi:hypothetical protein
LEFLVKLVGCTDEPLSDVSEPFGFVLCASGFERRARFVATELAARGLLPSAEMRYVLTFGDRAVLSRPDNDLEFARLGFRSIPVTGTDIAPIRRLILDVLAERPSDAVRFLVDISSMTRVQYAAVLRTLRDVSYDRPEVRVTFTYVPGSFVDSIPESSPLASFDPINGFSSIEDPFAPTALILGLGLEPGRAAAIKDLVDPAVTFAWYADPTVDLRYVDGSLAANRPLVREIGVGSLIPYPLTAPVILVAMLESQCAGLLHSHRVVLVPLGAKVFSLACLLVATRFTSITVCRATSGTTAEPVDRRPCGTLVSLSAGFQS